MKKNKRQLVWEKYLKLAGDVPAELKKATKNIIFNVWSDAKIESLLK